jgi:cell division protein FtsW (lipid II flippase)
MVAARSEQGGPGRPAPVTLPGSRRGVELAMLMFAIGVVLVAYLAVGLGLNGRVPSGFAAYGATYAVLMLGAHGAVRKFAAWADPLILPLAALLNGLGLVMIYRLQEVGRDGNPGRMAVPLSASATTTQFIYTTVGIACFAVVLALVRNAQVLQRYTYTAGAVGIVLIALPALLPASISEVQYTSAKIQVDIGGFSIQPEEFAKLAFATFFAGYLVAKRDVLSLAGRRLLGIDLPLGRDLGPVLLTWGISLLLLVFESDIGTSALFFGLFLAMIYIATQRTSWLLVGAALFTTGAFATSRLFSHVGTRFTAWLHPFAGSNATHSAYQLVQGLEGMGFGGIFGQGLGRGQPYYTPLVQSDFIVTAFGEELGLTGLMVILLLYGLIVQRGLRAAVAARDPFSKLLAGGLAFMLALQVFIIVGGVTRLIPLTGITTPFLSQGGSSLIASWVLMALLLRISDTARRPAPQSIQDEGMTQVVIGG